MKLSDLLENPATIPVAIQYLTEVLVGDSENGGNAPIAPAFAFDLVFREFAGEHVRRLTKVRLHRKHILKPDLHFSRKLRSLLDRRGLKPSAFAREFGISHVAVGNWLAGAVPKIDKLQRLAEFFEVRLQDLLFDAHLTKIADAESRAINEGGTDREVRARFDQLLEEADQEMVEMAVSLRERARKLTQLADAIDPPKRSPVQKQRQGQRAQSQSQS